jgi:hypothetical protein
LTEESRAPERSPFERVPKTESAKQRRGSSLIQISAAALTLGVVLAANTWINIPEVEFGRGVAEVPACTRDSVVDFDLQVFSTGTTIRALDVTDLGADCNGQYMSISLTSSTESVIRQFTAGPLSTATTLRLTVTEPGIDPETVFGMNLELSDSPF